MLITHYPSFIIIFLIDRNPEGISILIESNFIVINIENSIKFQE